MVTTAHITPAIVINRGKATGIRDTQDNKGIVGEDDDDQHLTLKNLNDLPPAPVRNRGQVTHLLTYADVLSDPLRETVKIIIVTHGIKAGR